jgi:hypothetical protein
MLLILVVSELTGIWDCPSDDMSVSEGTKSKTAIMLFEELRFEKAPFGRLT